MGTTPNNSFPYPEATGLVKDGWEDIKDLATSIDTKLGVYSPAGLSLIKTYTPSAVSSFSFDANTFSSSYDNYRVICNLSGSTSSAVYVRLRASGTDTTTGYYGSYTYMLFTSTAVNGAGNNNGSQILGITAVVNPTAARNFWVFDVGYPNLAYNTSVISQTFQGDSYWVQGAWKVDNSTQYDSMTIYPNTGTITGQISVYGYKK